MNFPIILAAALVPLVMGFVWYNPKVVGTVWMKESGLDEEKMKGANMPLIFGLSFVFAIMLAIQLTASGMIIHQAGVNSIFAAVKDVEGLAEKAAFLEKYGAHYRTFKHGVFHGVISGFFFALPIIGTGALFERRSFKYIAIHVGYWIITLALMGGIIGQWA